MFHSCPVFGKIAMEYGRLQGAVRMSDSILMHENDQRGRFSRAKNFDNIERRKTEKQPLSNGLVIAV